MQKVRGSNPRSSTSPRDPPPSHPSPNGGGCAIREARPTVTVTAIRRPHPHRALRPDGHRAALAGSAGTSSACTRRTSTTTSRPQVLPADDVPVPVGRPAHRALVHHDADRRARPLPPDARRERLLADRLRRLRPAGRERRDQERHQPARLDDAEHRATMRRQFRIDGRHVRLDARGRHLRARATTAGTSGSSCSSWRPGLAYRAEVAGRLVPQRRDAGPRAGRGRGPPLLALRRAGREARPGPVVPADHQVRRRAARLHRHRLAGADPDHADELDRPVRGRRGRLHDGARRRTSRAATSCASSRPGRTRCSGRRSWSWRPEHPLVAEADRARTGRPRSRPTSRRRGRETEIERLSTDREKTGVVPRRGRDQPGQRRADPDLDRRLRAGRLRHRRDHGRARPRRARLRLRPRSSGCRSGEVVAAARRRRGRRRSTSAYIAHARRRACWSTPGRFSGLAAPPTACGAIVARLAARRHGPSRPSPTACATG